MSTGNHHETVLIREGEEVPVVNYELNRFPCAVVYQPFPPLTWLFPLIGHMGIADSQGRVHDFQGPYTIIQVRSSNLRARRSVISRYGTVKVLSFVPFQLSSLPTFKSSARSLRVSGPYDAGKSDAVLALGSKPNPSKIEGRRKQPSKVGRMCCTRRCGVQPTNSQSPLWQLQSSRCEMLKYHAIQRWKLSWLFHVVVVDVFLWTLRGYQRGFNHDFSFPIGLWCADSYFARIVDIALDVYSPTSPKT